MKQGGQVNSKNEEEHLIEGNANGDKTLIDRKCHQRENRKTRSRFDLVNIHDYIV
jgi:hypothetical protein